MLSAALNSFHKLTGNHVSVKYLANKYKLQNIHKANAQSARRDQVLEKITDFDKWKLTQFWEMSFCSELVFTQVNVIHCASYVIQVIQDLQVVLQCIWRTSGRFLLFTDSSRVISWQAAKKRKYFFPEIVRS